MTKFFKLKSNTTTAALIAISALTLSACSTVNSKSKMSSQSVFGNSVLSSVPGYTYAPKEYNCGVGQSCGVLSAADCPITRRASVINQVQCYDGSIVSDISQCGPISRRAPTPVPASYVQAVSTDMCSGSLRQETVYYDHNRDRSTETAAAARRVLSYGQQCNINSVQVIGHADTSGSLSYNDGLSQRRAMDVKNELVRQGLDGARISTQFMGERQNAVDRGDGVREPLNRRTEVQVQASSRGYGY